MIHVHSRFSRKPGAVEVICDACEGESQTFEGDWEQVIAEAKRYGWQLRKKQTVGRIIAIPVQSSKGNN